MSSRNHPVPPRGADLRVLLVDDRPLMRAGVAGALAGDPLIGQVLEAGSMESAQTILQTRTVDVVIVSPDASDPVEGNHRFCALALAAGDARVVSLSRDEQALPPACGRFAVVPETVAAARLLRVVDQPATEAPPCAGASCGCRHTHIAPPTDLTAQEARVLAGLTDGLSNRQIAGQLGLAEKTVKNYVTRIYAKLGVTSRTAAIAALRDGVDGALHH
ncbi:response regulator transcription factor [Cumulibacter manganitolerans]|uniref:response regulator transcription factor n=1 Tax=Cumulibacter manganitolerans TaxID=1884992 RepID=UPI0018861C20|nr:response regulator transcription factor [Cumulibacter manganitolerans]